MYKNLIYDVDGKVAKITINRPKAMNALNEEVLSEMYEALLQFEGGSEKVAMITGAGKAFVAGADIQAMVSMDNLKAHELACLGHRLMNKIESCEKPVIAAINGFALEGGLELAMACDFRLDDFTVHAVDEAAMAPLCPDESMPRARLIVACGPS